MAEGIYAKHYTDILSDDKIIAAGCEGYTMWSKGVIYCRLHLTDGFIPDSIIPLIAIGVKRPKKTAELLVSVGLWKRCDGGYCLGNDHEGKDKYSKYQNTREEVEKVREYEREKKRKQRETNKDVPGVSPRDNAGTTEGTPPGVLKPEPEPIVEEISSGLTTSEPKLQDCEAEASSHVVAEEAVSPEKPKRIDPKVVVLKRAAAVLDYLRDASGRKISTDASNGNCKHLRALISGCLVNDRDSLMDRMRLVVDYKVAEWGSSAEMRTKLRPETLFAPDHWHTYLVDAEEWQDNGRPPPNRGQPKAGGSLANDRDLRLERMKEAERKLQTGEPIAAWR